MTQPSLFDGRTQPAYGPADVAILVGHLAGRGWTTAKQLKAFGFNDRELRAIANASKGQIVGGQSGYALVREISDDEADHIEAALTSQARKMLQRVVEIRNARNRKQSAAA